MYPLFIITVLLLFGVGLVFAQTDRQAVMAHWSERRCDLSVILASHLYKPANDPTSSTKFATENLKFCTNKLIKEVFTVALNPFLSLLGQQLKFTKVIEEVLSSVKGMLANFFKSFSRILGGVYQRFIAVGFNFRKTFVMFLSAMNRAFGIAIGSLYSGISVLVTVQNLVDAVIKIVLIVLGILAGLVIILFLAFFPVIPVIITTITVMVAGVAAGFAAAGGAGPLKSVFCFTPSTPVETMRGMIPIDQIKLGDTLKDGGVVEGVLTVNGSSTEIYNLGGIRVSGDHLVFYEPLAKWILVKEHPEARKELKQEPILVCLNTSTREIPIGKFRFRDWEEIPPESPEIQQAWNELVASMLGCAEHSAADQYPLLSGAWLVQTPEGKVALRDVTMGMKILDIDGSWTRVIGIYNGTEELTGGSETFWFTDSIWWKQGDTWAQAHHMAQEDEKKFQRKGVHLVTGSGTFKLFSLTDEKSVRDFTEVGQARIAETYEWMKARL